MRLPFHSTAAAAIAVEHAVRNAGRFAATPSVVFEVSAKTVMTCPFGLS